MAEHRGFENERKFPREAQGVPLTEPTVRGLRDAATRLGVDPSALP